jgi:hypothetical protein
VVLETDGSFSVIASDDQPNSALESVQIPPRPGAEGAG